MKSKRHESLRGAVLIMVLTVMFVLIIMLMATLTVVSTAGQRIYTKYEENQAYYTARSALDVFTQNMLSDADYYAYDSSGKRKYEYTDNTVSPAVEKDADMKQGKALQLDLYKIRSQAETAAKEGYTEGTNTYHDLKWAENAVLDDNTFLTGTPEDENYSLSKTDSYTKNGTTYKGLEYIEYDVTLPAVSDGSNKYAKMLDTDRNDKDGDGDKTDQVARIKVEVLDRHYATDPTYTASQMAEIVNGSDTTKQAELRTAIQNGQRSKDYMKIKVTATVELEGVEGTAIVIFETIEKETPASNHALTTTGGFSGGSGAQVRVAGGVASMDIGVSALGDGNNMSGTAYTLGTFNIVSSSGTTLNKGEQIIAMNGLTSTNDAIINSNGEGTFAFLGGTNNLSHNDRFGDASHNVPLIAEKIVKTSSNEFKIFGDAYVNTFEYTDSNPFNVNVSGTLYVQNLVLPDSYFIWSDPYWDLDTTKINLSKIKLCDNYTIKNVSGTVNVNPTNLNTTLLVGGAAVGSHASFANASSRKPFDINDFTAVKKDEKIYRQYAFPDTNFQLKDSKGNPLTSIEIPSAQAYFGEFFIDDAFHETTGDLKNYTNQTNADPADPVNAYATIYGDTNKNAWLKTGADMLAEYLELPALPAGERYVIGTAGANQTSIIDKIGSGNVLPLPVGGGELDVSTGDKYYLMDGSYSGCTWTVKGSGRAIFLIPEDSNTKLLDGTGNVDWSTHVTTRLDNCKIITEDIDESTDKITNGTTKAPHVDIYGGTGSYLCTGNQNAITGYIMMPTGFCYMNNGGKLKGTIEYNNGNGGKVNISNTAIVGSLICKEFAEANQTGIIYLNKDSGADEPGEPHLTVQASRYSRT